MLQVVPALEVGGVERGTVDVAAGLVRAGWRAVVASSGGAMAEQIRRAGGVHVELPLARKTPWALWRNARALGELVREHRVDIVHARSRAPAWSARAAARRRGVPFVTTFHGVYGSAGRAKRAYNSVMAKGDAVIAVSDFVGRHVAETYHVPPERLRVIHRGIDTEYFDPKAVSDSRVIDLARQWRLPDGWPVVMLPGRPARWKGHGTLIDAAALLGRRDLCILLVGADQGRDKSRYRRELEARIAAAGLQGIFRLTRSCRDMPVAYMLADLVVSSSTEPEAFGRVAVEAQAMGRPVVATDHGGSRETVIDGETGRLVPPDDPGALADAIRSLLALAPGERSAMSRRARKNALARFTTERMCDRTLALYRDLLEA